MTLLEVAISVGLLGFVVASIFGLYLLGLKLWSGSDSRAQVLSSLQKSNQTLRRSVSQSNEAGVSLGEALDPPILVLISAQDGEGRTEISEQGNRRWLSWEVIYVEEETLKLARIPWGAGESEREVPVPFEVATGLGFTDVTNRGRPISRHIKSVRYSLEPGSSLLSVDWEFSLASRQKPDGEKIRSTSAFRFRN